MTGGALFHVIDNYFVSLIVLFHCHLFSFVTFYFLSLLVVSFHCMLFRFVDLFFPLPFCFVSCFVSLIVVYHRDLICFVVIWQTAVA